MSFFSRLSNLISGFSHTLINNVEQNNPAIKEELRKQEIHKQNKDLQEAMTHLKILENKLETQRKTATEEEAVVIEAEIEKHRSERKKIEQLLQANRNRSATEPFAEYQNQRKQESEAEEAIGRLRAHTEVLEHLIKEDATTKRPIHKKKQEIESNITEKDDTPKPKRTL